MLTQWVIAIKEDTCGEQWVLYVSDESLNSTAETNKQKVENRKFMTVQCVLSSKSLI